nr:uncharacterized protein LOC102459390 [Pelodiscus sinensis]|eukprot:XP_014428361.1 uncharacterized protein LOC102459390 [Pelodiscus sinensis]
MSCETLAALPAGRAEGRGDWGSLLEPPESPSSREHWAPQGTFRDELEWCILQLETGLLRLGPTPEQACGTRCDVFVLFVSVGLWNAAEETQRVLRILRSRKAPFVKKRQVMSHVFGDYRLKMAEERKRVEKAAMKPGKAQIQQGNAQASGSVVYRKRSGQTSESIINWFAPSDNSFQFNFALSERDPQATDATLEESQGTLLSLRPWAVWVEDTQKPELAPVDEVGAGKAAAAGAPKKKKKKKKKPSNSKKEMAEAEVNRKVKVGASGCEDTDKTSQQSDEQLWREVDWCVEQLELGLRTHKSTPKQAEEAYRAIKTLRSDKAVLAKKRQVMRAMFGDYRKKMEEERQKQLKLMQAAAKSAEVTEVRENARRRSSHIFRRRSEASRKSPSAAGSPSHPPSRAEPSQASGTSSFVFPACQEEFRFNFF